MALVVKKIVFWVIILILFLFLFGFSGGGFDTEVGILSDISTAGRIAGFIPSVPMAPSTPMRR